MSEAKNRVVLCMRWGRLYPPAYVNVLFNAVKDHLSGPFRFVCFTDDPQGLDAGIETRPIPDLGYSDYHWKSGAWPKLSVFSDLEGLHGRALFIDLDSVIVGELEPFFERQGEFLGIGVGADWRMGGMGTNPDLGTGVFAFDLGGLQHVAATFSADPKGAFDTFALEQRFVERHVPGWQPWENGWVISFKRHLCQPLVIDRFRPPLAPPAGAKIVAFHGDPRPIDVVARTGRNWAGFPRYGRSPVPWVRDYWLNYGGADMVAEQDNT